MSTSTLIETVFGTSTPIMEQISKCESDDRQFDDNGDPLVSSTDDWGYYQINQAVWGETAEKLGLDYKHRFSDNLLMAKVIYDDAISHGRSGFSPWVCSKHISVPGD